MIDHYNESTMIDACSRLYDSSYFKFRNFFYRYDHEADVFVISRSRYATEIEVKISLSDWKADLVKAKHSSHKELKHFYYAVPPHLVDKSPEGIDDRYGLIVCTQLGENANLIAKIIKPAQDLKGTKVSVNTILKAFKSTYYRQFDSFNQIRLLRSENARLRTELKEKSDMKTTTNIDGVSKIE